MGGFNKQFLKDKRKNAIQKNKMNFELPHTNIAVKGQIVNTLAL